MCQRTVMNGGGKPTLFRRSRAGATFAPHAVPTPCGARGPAPGRVRVLHLQPWETRPSAGVRGARGRNRPQRHQPQLSRRGGLRAARWAANARGNGDRVVQRPAVCAATAAGYGTRVTTVRPCDCERRRRPNADPHPAAGTIHRVDARDGPTPLERGGILKSLLLAWRTPDRRARAGPANQPESRRGSDEPGNPHAHQQHAAALRQLPHLHRRDPVVGQRHPLAGPRDLVAPDELHGRHREDQAIVVLAHVPAACHEHARAEVACEIHAARVGEGDGQIRTRLGSRLGQGAVVVAAGGEARGSDRHLDSHLHSVQWALDPGPVPPPSPPPDAGPNAWDAITNAATAAPASNTVLLGAIERCSTCRTNSPGTTTVSPAPWARSPRRDSTDSTEIASPRSVADR